MRGRVDSLARVDNQASKEGIVQNSDAKRGWRSFLAFCGKSKFEIDTPLLLFINDK